MQIQIRRQIQTVHSLRSPGPLESTTGPCSLVQALVEQDLYTFQPMQIHVAMPSGQMLTLKDIQGNTTFYALKVLISKRENVLVREQRLYCSGHQPDDLPGSRALPPAAHRRVCCRTLLNYNIGWNGQLSMKIVQPHRESPEKRAAQIVLPSMDKVAQIDTGAAPPQPADDGLPSQGASHGALTASGSSGQVAVATVTASTPPRLLLKQASEVCPTRAVANPLHQMDSIQIDTTDVDVGINLNHIDVYRDALITHRSAGGDPLTPPAVVSENTSWKKQQGMCYCCGLCCAAAPSGAAKCAAATVAWTARTHR